MPGARLALAPEAQARSSPRELDGAQPDARREQPLPRRRDDARARRQVAEAHAGRRPPSRTTAAPRRPCGPPQSGSSPTRRAATTRLRASASTSARTGGMYASSSSTRPPTFTRGATCHQSRIGYGKPCAPSTSTRSSGRCSSPAAPRARAQFGTRPATRRSRGPQPAARKRSSSSAAGVTASCSAPARCEDERRRARPGLERRHPGPHLALEPLERLPREPPVLRAARVQARRLAPKLVGQGPTRLSSPRVAKRALITGIGGQDGSLLAELLLDKGYEVSGVVRRYRRELPEPHRDPRAHRPRRGRPERPARPRPRAPREPSARGLQPRVGLVRSRVLGAARAHRRARRRRRDRAARGDPRGRSRDSLLPGVARARSSASLLESPQTEETPLSPLTPYGVAKAYAHFIVALVPPPLRPARLGRDPLQPRVAAAPARVRPAQGRAAPRPRSRSGSGGRALARRPRLATRLGLCGRLRARDVADGAAGRGRRLRRRDRRDALRARPRRHRVRARRPRLGGVRPHRRVARARQGRAAQPRRRPGEGEARARLGADRHVRGARPS